MKRVFIYIIFLVVLSFLQPIIATKSHASVPYEASDVLGQTDPESQLDRFDLNKSNNQNLNANGFDSPNGIAIDSIGHRLFSIDYNNNRILIFNLDENNHLADRSADYILGGPSFTSINIFQTTQSGFRHPRSVLYDSENSYLYVSDTRNHRVLIFNTTNLSNNMNAIYVLGQPDFDTGGSENDSSFGSDITAKGFKSPVGLALDQQNNRLYVADTENLRVLVFNTSSISNNMDASYVLGQSNFTSKAFAHDAKTLEFAVGLGFDPVTQYLYVADSGSHQVGGAFGSAHDRVLVFDTSTISNYMSAIYVLGQPTFSSVTSVIDGLVDAKGFSQPTGIALDSTRQRLYVIDGGYGANRVLVFDINSLSNNMDASYVLGQANFTTTGSGTTIRNFSIMSSVEGIVYDELSEQLFVSDLSNNRILIFDTSSLANYMNASDLIGQTDSNGSIDYTLANRNNTKVPSNVGFSLSNGGSTAVDSIHHRLFVSDVDNCRILVFNLDNSNNLLDNNADYVLGQPDFTSSECGEVGEAYRFNYVGGMTYDPVNDRLFVTDTYSWCRIDVFDTTTIVNGESAVNVIGSDDINTPGACNHTQNTFQGGWYDGGITLDSSNQRLYVMDGAYCRLLVFDVTPQTFVNGLDAVNILGTNDFNSEGSCGTNASEFYPYYSNSPAIDTETQLLYLPDEENYRVLVFNVNPSSIVNGEDASYVLGQEDLISNEYYNPPTSRSINNASNIAIDEHRKLLYVQSSSPYRIMIFDVNSIDNNEAAIGIIGQSDFDQEETGTSNSLFWFSWYESSLALDSINRHLYVADSSNNRVLIFDFAHLINLNNSSPSVGTSVSQTLGSGYQGTTTYTLDSGTLPPGVSFNTSTGLLSGTYTTPGTYAFTISISDDNGNAGVYEDTKTYTLNVGGSQSSVSSPRPEGEYSTTEAPVCNTPKPDSIPSLFQIERSYDHATIHFTPTKDNTTYYLLSYGTDSNAQGYSVTIQQPDDTSGAISYRIKSLNPKTSYYFKVRNGNSCNPGTFSQTRKDTNQLNTITTTSVNRTSIPTNTNSNDNEQTTRSSTNQTNNQPNTSPEQKQTQQTDTNPTENNQPHTPWYMRLWGWITEKLGL